MSAKLNSDQKRALEVLNEGSNIFLTGAAGSGKSFLIREFLRKQGEERFPILASTGAAAILVGGRTFHSFFGLGILEGGSQATIDRALKNKPLKRRLKKTDGIVLDEVSMISGPVLKTAEAIARKVRECDEPWGGLRVIAVGDFAQLPPVNPFSQEKEWAFLDPVWEASQFQPAVLNQIMRTTDEPFLQVLNQVRSGSITSDGERFLTSRRIGVPTPFQGTRLLARRNEVEQYNLSRLGEISSPVRTFETQYSGKPEDIEKFRKNAPIPDVLQLKPGALIMLRQNDPDQRWVNGSLGQIEEIRDLSLSVRLLTGREVLIERVDFTLLNAEGIPVATANNFPVTLSWAITIHKAQGATLDRLWVDLRGLWEPGQAYVALSRVKSSQGLFIEGWHPRSILADPAVKAFHRSLQAGEA